MNEEQRKMVQEIADICVGLDNAKCDVRVGTFEISFYIDGRSTIDVYPPKMRYNKPYPAEVNWSAIGSVSPEIAVNYANTIKAAAAVAAVLNKWSLTTWTLE